MPLVIRVLFGSMPTAKDALALAAEGLGHGLLLRLAHLEADAHSLEGQYPR